MRPPFGDMKTFCLLLLGIPALAAAVPVSGTLVGPSGKPLAATTMTGYAWRKTTKGKPDFNRFSVVTDKAGAFRFESPALPTRESPLVLIARLADGRYGTVRLTAGRGATKLDLATASLRVRAVDLKGSPVAGALVLLTDVLIMPRTQTDFNSIGEIPKPDLSRCTDVQGYAEFKGLPKEAMILFDVKKSGMLSGRGRIDRLDEGSEQRVTLDQSSTVRGRVLREGKPVPGVMVVSNTVRDGMGRAETVKTDANGEYRLEAAAGSNGLSLDLGPLAQDWTAKGYEDLRLKPGGELNGLNFVLEKGILLQGTVLSKQGDKPVPNAKVWMRGPGGMDVQTASDAKGRFSGRIVPGSWYVAIDKVADRRLGNQVYLSAEIDAEHNPALELRVPDAALLRPIANLDGSVVDAAGAPVPGAIVRKLNGGSVTSDAAGRFRFEEETEPGTLVIASRDGAMTTQAVEIGEAATISLRLDGAPSSVQGVLVDDAGRPLSGVEVTLSGQSSGGYVAVPPAVTDAKGAYRFDGLFGGIENYYLWAKKKGYGPITIQPIHPKPGETTTLETKTMAVADGTIDGVVYEVDGKPAVGARVSSQVQGVPSVETDAKGRFHLAGVPRGKHYVVAGRGGAFGAGAEGVTGQKDVTIRLEPPFKSVPGTVQGDHTGRKAPEIDVAAWLGQSPDLQALKGKIVVIDFWAVWCGPCVGSLPQVQALHERYAKQGVVVLGIHTPDRTKDVVAAFVKAKGLTYPNALDGKEDSGQGKTAMAFGPSGIPHLFVIDAQGKIVLDTHEVEGVERTVARLLKESSGP